MDALSPKKSYTISLAITLGIYFVVYAWMLISSAYVPYVMDGNESYSSLLHAQNLYHFDLTKSMGMADEAASPEQAAHPFLHTHQGNFPRVFAYLIYLFGARDIESQIVVTTFTVGLASIIFGFIFFARISGPIFALTVSVLLMTDYLLFAQWQVVTYRVWHGFFIFSSLLCAQGIGSQRRLLWTVLTVLNHMCLFYGELVFAAFTAIMTGLYTAWIYRREWKAVALGWGVQTAGAVIGMAVVAIQLLLYLGWNDLLRDLHLTMMARNYVPDDPAWLQQLVEFFNTRNIVFWYNFRSAETHAGVGSFLRSIFSYSFLVHTPFLTLIVLLIVTGWLAGVAAMRMSRSRSFSSMGMEKEIRGVVACGFLVTFGLVILLYKFVLEDVRMIGEIGTGFTLPLGRAVLLAMVSLSLVGYVTSVIIRQAWHASCVDGHSPTAKVLVAGLYLCGVGSFVGLQGLLYKPEWRILWADTMGPSYRWIALAVAVGTVMFGLVLIIRTPQRILFRGFPAVRGIMPFLVTGLIALLIVYKLAPGYIHSGYFERFAPFVVFHVDGLVATALFMLLAAAWTAFTKVRIAYSLERPALVRTWGRLPALAVIGCLSLSAYFLFYWMGLQARYVQLFPYDSFGFMKIFREAPYRGSSFVVNNYAAPTFIYTGQWAYYDPEIDKGKLKLTADGFTVGRDLRALWFADRDIRKDYLKPEYFLCLTGRSVWTVMESLSPEKPRTTGCGRVELVKQAATNSAAVLRHRLVDQDTSPNKLWAVVKLDWDYPPFLETSTSENDTGVQLKVTKTSTGWKVDVDYRYRQQDGMPEGETEVRLYLIEPDSNDPTGPEATRASRPLARGIRQRHFLLPRHFEGFLQATVTPATATKSGPQYTSKPVRIGAQVHSNRQDSSH